MPIHPIILHSLFKKNMNSLKPKSHAVFVDGENFSIRMEKIEKLTDCEFRRPNVKDSFNKQMFWHLRYSQYFNNLRSSDLLRIYYYGSMKIGGFGDEIDSQRLQLQEIGIGETFAVAKGQTKQTKTVDIKLATDVLSLAASGRVDEIYLIAMDADYIPVIQKAKSYGVKMTLVFPGFDLLEIKAVENDNKLKSEMGIPKSKDFLLSFDRIDTSPKWFDYNRPTIEDKRIISEKIIDKLSALLPKRSWLIETNDGKIKIISNENECPNFVFDNEGKLNIMISRTGTSSSGTSINLFPSKTFYDRLDLLLDREVEGFGSISRRL